MKGVVVVEREREKEHEKGVSWLVIGGGVVEEAGKFKKIQSKLFLEAAADAADSTHVCLCE